MRTVPVLALVVITSACSNSGPEERARALAASVQALAPKEVGRGLVMTGAAADGATLVLRFSGVPERYAQISSDEIQADLKPVACNVDGYRRAIDGGNPLRFELSTTGGQDLPPVTVSEC